MNQFYGERQEILLKTSFDMDRVVVFVPGMSGKAHSGRFAWLDQAADAAGYASARVNLWEDADELQTLTWQQVQERLAAVVTLLEQQGFVEMVLVGKSFGGAVCLMYEHELVSKKVLWSPAVTYTEAAGNLSELENQTLGTIEKLTDITVSKHDLPDSNRPIRIIHGDTDEVIGVENSQHIAATVTDGEVSVITGADHSFKAPEAAAQLEDLTKEYLHI